MLGKSKKMKDWCTKLSCQITCTDNALQTELYNCYTMPGGTLSHSSSTSSMPICR